MAEIVNLRQARKQKARTDKEAKAAENRIAFGRTKEERRLNEARNASAKRHLEGHKRDDKTP